MASRTLSTITTALRLDNRAFKKGLGNSKKDVNKFTKSMKSAGAAIGGAFALRRVIQFTAEVSKLAGAADGVARAFKRIAPNAAFMEDLKRATSGTVSELDLMRRAVMASNFKIPLNDLAGLFEFATKRAQETGESVAFLVNSIVLGIGRKAPLILDNLGISAVSLRQKLENVGHSGATVLDVSRAVVEIAKEEMAAMGSLAETAAIRWERIAAATTDLKVEIGNAANEMAMEFLPVVKKALNDMTLMALALQGGGKLTEFTRQKAFASNLGPDIDNEKAAAALEIQKRMLLGFSEEEATRKVINEELVHFHKMLGQAYSPRNEARYKAYISAFREWRDGMLGANAPGPIIAGLKAQIKATEETMDQVWDITKLEAYRVKLVQLKSELKELLEGVPKVAKVNADPNAVPLSFDAMTTMGGLTDLGGGRGAQTSPGIDYVIDGMVRFSNIVMDINQGLDLTTDYFDDIAESLDEMIANENPFDDIDPVDEEMKNLGKTVGVMLVSQFDSLGEAIGRNMAGAEEDLNKLGQSIMNNLGNILIMAGFQSGNVGMVIAGAAIQLGSGISKGLGADPITNRTGGNFGGGASVMFNISGKNLVGVMDRNSNYNTQVT